MRIDAFIRVADITEFKQKGDNFVNEFCGIHDTTPNILYGLILDTAIVVDDFEIIDQMISILSSFSPKDVLDAITCLNDCNMSVISTSLYEKSKNYVETILPLIDIVLNSGLKTECEDEEKHNLDMLTRLPQIDDVREHDPNYCYNLYRDKIFPLYTDESIREIRELLERIDR